MGPSGLKNKRPTATAESSSSFAKWFLHSSSRPRPLAFLANAIPMWLAVCKCCMLALGVLSKLFSVHLLSRLAAVRLQMFYSFVILDLLDTFILFLFSFCSFPFLFPSPFPYSLKSQLLNSSHLYTIWIINNKIPIIFQVTDQFTKVIK